MSLRFTCDPSKAESNLNKHGVSFEEALTVFHDLLSRIFADEYHSGGELREIIIGHSSRGRLFVVSFTERQETIRIISARLATPKERRDYEKASKR